MNTELLLKSIDLSSIAMYLMIITIAILVFVSRASKHNSSKKK